MYVVIACWQWNRLACRVPGARKLDNGHENKKTDTASVRSDLVRYQVGGLRNLLGNKKVAMAYENYEYNIRRGRAVEIANWPEGVDMVRPSKLSMPVAREIRDGTIYWRCLLKAEHAELLEGNGDEDKEEEEEEEDWDDEDGPRAKGKGKGKGITKKPRKERSDKGMKCIAKATSTPSASAPSSSASASTSAKASASTSAKASASTSTSVLASNSTAADAEAEEVQGPARRRRCCQRHHLRPRHRRRLVRCPRRQEAAQAAQRRRAEEAQEPRRDPIVVAAPPRMRKKRSAKAASYYLALILPSCGAMAGVMRQYGPYGSLSVPNFLLYFTGIIRPGGVDLACARARSMRP
ncbi:hypothetical protein DFH09DRAFT_1101029 [Mycena vulgaris]|nr:hypothetical protein DFH09DRAFT_1101029 [Mycena vulgaris]